MVGAAKASVAVAAGGEREVWRRARFQRVLRGADRADGYARGRAEEG